VGRSAVYAGRMPATAHDAPVVHLARPHRPVLVAGTLRELTGPATGMVELPQRLWWHPRRAFDLGHHDSLLWMYENVLREAVRVDELRGYLHGPTLLRVWPELNLPRGVRAAWEARHARLRRAAAAAGAATSLATTPAAASARTAGGTPETARATTASSETGRTNATGPSAR
jgi:hypothetical protein